MNAHPPLGINLGMWARSVLGGAVAPRAWLPSDLGSALVGWFDAQTTSSITLNGSNVSAWASRVGSAVASQGTAIKQPAKSATGLNGLPCIVGASGKSLLSAVTLAQPFSMAAVAQVTDVSVNHPLIASSALNDFEGLYYSAGGNVGLTIQVPGAWTNGTGTATFFSCNVNNGASSLFSYNGTTNGTFNPGTGGLSNVVLMNWAQSGSEFWVGPMGEIVLVNTALSTSDRQKLEGYLAWHWGLQAKLPGGHPYQSAAPLFP